MNEITKAVEVAPVNTIEVALEDAGVLVEQAQAYNLSRKRLLEWIAADFKDGVDYHVIKGKQSLSKAGAEKVVNMLRLRPVFKRDDDTWQMLGSTPGFVCYVCELVTPSGQIVAEGRGARDINKENGDINKTIKMAQKSAVIDCTLRISGLSTLFTQDLEDLPDSEITPKTASTIRPPQKLNSGSAAAPTAQPPVTSVAPPTTKSAPVASPVGRTANVEKRAPATGVVEILKSALADPIPELDRPDTTACSLAVGILQDLKVAKGSKNGKEWVRFGIVVSGKTFGTFSATVGSVAEQLKGKKVKLFYDDTGKYQNAVWVEPASSEDDLSMPSGVI